MNTWWVLCEFKGLRYQVVESFEAECSETDIDKPVNTHDCVWIRSSYPYKPGQMVNPTKILKDLHDRRRRNESVPYVAAPPPLQPHHGAHVTAYRAYQHTPEYSITHGFVPR